MVAGRVRLARARRRTSPPPRPSRASPCRARPPAHRGARPSPPPSRSPRAGVDALHQQLAEASQRVADELLQHLARGAVEPVEGVVEHQQRGARGECTGQQDLADLAGRDRAHRPVEQRVQSEAHGEVLGCRAERATVAKRLVHGAARGQQLHVRLERDPGAAAGPLQLTAQHEALVEQRLRKQRLAVPVAA
eukprot:scaffold77432_cov60-Phaeocystis_antarctica.AAC.3